MVTSRVRIESIAAGGDGVGRSDGMAVFVPRAAPGDVLEAALDVRGRFARGAIVSLLEPSAARVDPPCIHYMRDRCGGCQLQHLAYDAQLDAKSSIVRESMRRIGKRDVDPVDVHASPSVWHYRTKLTLALRWHGDRWIAGLHPFDNPGRVFQLETCLITDERVLAVWRDVLAAAHLLPRAPRLRGAVRLTEDAASFVLEGASHWPSAEAFADHVPRVTAIWWEPTGGKRRRLVVDRRASASSPGASEARVRSPDASFVQVNPTAAAVLHQHIIALTLAHAPASVVDAYAGAGEPVFRHPANPAWDLGWLGVSRKARLTAKIEIVMRGTIAAAKLVRSDRSVRIVNHVLLVAVDGGWKIADLTCSNPLPAG